MSQATLRFPVPATPRRGTITQEWPRQPQSPESAAAKWRRCRARTAGSRCAARTSGSPTASRSTIRTSELLDVRDHAGAHRRIRQLAVGGGQVLANMIDARGGGDRASHGRVRNDEFEDDLCPARAADLRRPAWQRMALQLPRQLALAKRAVDDDGDAAIFCQRQNAILDLAVEDIVGHLHEIERLRAHDLLNVTMAPSFRGGDADIAKLAGRFHGEQRSQMLFPGQQIVDLQQIEAGHTPVSTRGVDLAG